MSTYDSNRYAFPTSTRISELCDARLTASNVTQHVTATTSIEGDWTPSCSNGAMNISEGRYYKVGKLVMCVASLVLSY